jgi:hypothetical protein
MKTDLPCAHNDDFQKIPPVDNNGKKDEALISPQRDGISQWKTGMVEKWNNGYKKADGFLILISDEGNLNKIRSCSAKPNIPAFHYSSTHNIWLQQSPWFLN